jgi:hypothetical protein
MPSLGAGRTATPPPQKAVGNVNERSGMHPRTTALPSEGPPPGPSGPMPSHPGPLSGGHPRGTMVLPESGLPPGTQGLPAGPSGGWPSEPSHAFRDVDPHGTQPGIQRSEPAGALFWIAWALLGLGGGLAAHFWIIHRASGG